MICTPNPKIWIGRPTVVWIFGPQRACRANLPLQGNILDEKVLDAWLDDAANESKACQQRILFIIFFRLLLT